VYTHERIFLAGISAGEPGMSGANQQMLFADYSENGEDGQLKSIDFGTLLTQWGVTHTVPP